MKWFEHASSKHLTSGRTSEYTVKNDGYATSEVCDDTRITENRGESLALQRGEDVNAFWQLDLWALLVSWRASSRIHASAWS